MPLTWVNQEQEAEPEGIFFMSSNAAMSANNGPVLNIAQIIKTVMTSAAEAEIGVMYINAREAVPQRMTLSEEPAVDT